uniref:PH01B031C15.14 protein n=1 Tax=Phyllostachys edulis TaxID=38705 RepID=L0P1T6_PHYED|nr:PH01B031C15.14 [Phyllostachys edulis]
MADGRRRRSSGEGAKRKGNDESDAMIGLEETNSGDWKRRSRRTRERKRLTFIRTVEEDMEFGRFELETKMCCTHNGWKERSVGDILEQSLAITAARGGGKRKAKGFRRFGLFVFSRTGRELGCSVLRGWKSYEQYRRSKLLKIFLKSEILGRGRRGSTTRVVERRFDYTTWSMRFDYMSGQKEVRLHNVVEGVQLHEWSKGCFNYRMWSKEVRLHDVVENVRLCDMVERNKRENMARGKELTKTKREVEGGRWTTNDGGEAHGRRQLRATMKEVGWDRRRRGTAVALATVAVVKVKQRRSREKNGCKSIRVGELRLFSGGNYQWRVGRRGEARSSFYSRGREKEPLEELGVAHGPEELMAWALCAATTCASRRQDRSRSADAAATKASVQAETCAGKAGERRALESRGAGGQKLVAAELQALTDDGTGRCCEDADFSLPRIDQLVNATSGYELMSFLDAYFGYHQIFMAKEDESKTAFITPIGTYCFTRMPFGLKNMGATFTWLITKVLAKQLDHHVEAYVDDIMVKMVSAVLVQEHNDGHRLVYYVLEALQWDKVRYMKLEKLVYALLMASRKLQHYFLAHAITAPMSYLLMLMLRNKDASGRVGKWATKPAPFDLTFAVHTTIKSQAIADFITKWTPNSRSPLPQLEAPWTIYIDGSWYLATVHGAMKHFLNITVQTILRGSNEAADKLTKLASSVPSPPPNIFYEVLHVPSAAPKAQGVAPEAQGAARGSNLILLINEADSRDAIAKYLKGEEPEDPVEAKRL